jgi:hypothetical protein
VTQAIAQVVNDRALFVKNRLLDIGKNAANLILEAGGLLKEYRANAYYKEDGYESFDHAIDSMQSAGQLDFGSRQARNLISVVEMVERLSLPDEKIHGLGISKLREIATIKDDGEKRKLLEASSEMSVHDVQKAAKKIRDRAAGRESDPLDPLTLILTETQKTFYKECITRAREVYSIDDNVPEAAVLEAILAEWRSGL